MKDFNIGDKVEVPIKKTNGICWERCNVIAAAIRYNQNYLFVVDVHPTRIELNNDATACSGEFFDFEDIRLFNNNSPDLELIQVLRTCVNEIYGKEI